MTLSWKEDAFSPGFFFIKLPFGKINLIMVQSDNPYISGKFDYKIRIFNKILPIVCKSLEEAKAVAEHELQHLQAELNDLLKKEKLTEIIDGDYHVIL